MHRRTPRTVVALAAGLVLFAAACSDKQDVGQGLNTDLQSKLNELTTSTTAGAEGATTTTARPVGIDTTAPTTAKPVATTAATVKQTTTTADLSFPVSINGDKSGKTQFEPNSIGPIRIGGKVKFTNNDPEKMRYVISQDANFRSPDLAPGQSWVYTANKSGTFQLKDGTRPYATATLQVA